MQQQQRNNYEKFIEFFGRYYRDECLKHASKPNETTSLTVDASDLAAYDGGDGGLVDQWLSNPSETRTVAEDALRDMDLPQTIQNTNVRLVGNEANIDRVGVPELQDKPIGSYQAVSGVLNDMSAVKTRLEEVCFVCGSCGTKTFVPQSYHEFKEPEDCSGCDRPRFNILPEKSAETPHVKIEVAEPPEDSGSSAGQSIIGFVDDDLVTTGDDSIHNHAGERAVVFGEVVMRETDLKGRGNVTPTFTKDLIVHAVRYGDGSHVVEYEDHLDELRELGQHGVEWEAPEYIDVAPNHPAWAIAHSLTPGLKMNKNLAQVGLGVTAFIAGAYRMDTGDDSYRGTINLGLIGDPSTGKSQMAQKAAVLSPLSRRASAPDVSKVGLTAAAIEGGLGDGKYTLQPGIMPRANGGHAIVEEADKIENSKLDPLHDALEDPQQVNVSKGGIQATLNTRAGLLITANPEGQRFTRGETVGEQIDIPDALFSRFDLMFGLRDSVNEAFDRDVVDHKWNAMAEASEYEAQKRNSHSDPDKPETDAPISSEWLKMWFAACRDECYPVLPQEGTVADRLKDWFVEERQDNDERDDAAVSITFRKFEDGARLAIAFARIRFADTVEKQDADLAIHLSKRMMGDLYFDPETGEMDADRLTGGGKSQQQKIKRIEEALTGGLQYPSQISQEAGIKDEEYVRDQLKNMVDGKTNVDATVEEKNGKFRRLA